MLHFGANCQPTEQMIIIEYSDILYVLIASLGVFFFIYIENCDEYISLQCIFTLALCPKTGLLRYLICVRNLPCSYGYAKLSLSVLFCHVSLTSHFLYDGITANAFEARREREKGKRKGNSRGTRKIE